MPAMQHYLKLEIQRRIVELKNANLVQTLHFGLSSTTNLNKTSVSALLPINLGVTKEILI